MQFGTKKLQFAAGKLLYLSARNVPRRKPRWLVWHPTTLLSVIVLDLLDLVQSELNDIEQCVPSITECQCTGLIYFLSVQCNALHGTEYKITCGVCLCFCMCVCAHGVWSQISRKWLEIEVRFQWGTNRKWHMADRLFTWPMTSLWPR